MSSEVPVYSWLVIGSELGCRTVFLKNYVSPCSIIMARLGHMLTEPAQTIRWRSVALPPCGRHHSHIKGKRTPGYGSPDMAVPDNANSAARELTMKWHGLATIPQRWRERRPKNRVGFIRCVHFAEACHKFKHYAGDGQQSSSPPPPAYTCRWTIDIHGSD